MAARLPEEELYDTEKDPHEVNNLAKASIAAHVATLKRLREELEKWIQETKDQGGELEPSELVKPFDKEMHEWFGTPDWAQRQRGPLPGSVTFRCRVRYVTGLFPERSLTVKATTWVVPAALVIFFCGLALGVMFFGNPAVAQTGSTSAAGRYQISAYAGSTNAGVGHGCYLVDTATGQVWHTRLGGSAEKVSGKLP